VSRIFRSARIEIAVGLLHASGLLWSRREIFLLAGRYDLQRVVRKRSMQMSAVTSPCLAFLTLVQRVAISTLRIDFA
jgi:hypothetical protein